MAAGAPIPDENHVTRLCLRGYDDGEILSTAFTPRPQDQNRLSVNWVECAHVGPVHRNIEGSIARLAAIPTTEPDQPVAVLQAKSVREIQRNGCQLDVVERGSQRNLCHSVIEGMTAGPIDLSLQQDLADLANAGEVKFLP